MNKRVYGVIGVSSLMANWNADFSGYPKTTSDGVIFGSDKALKYPMKKMWDEEGEKVLFLKSMRFEEDKKNKGLNLIPRTLGERFEQLFPDVEQKIKDARVVLSKLFEAVDVKNFGATYAEQGMNISITGAVQFGQGLNKYADSTTEIQDILSPFRDPTAKEKSKTGEDAKQSTLGTKIVSNEAHYFYSFNVNPSAYKGFVELGVTEGYTEEDYQDFKRVSRASVTSYATNAKAGCENELAVFIETEPNLYLPNLAEYIFFEKGESKNQIKLSFDNIIVDVIDRIQSIEVFYNTNTTDIEKNLPKARYFDIITEKEV